MFQFAVDIGRMGFIQLNHSRILYNNIMININILKDSMINKVERYFYSSSSCVYPEYKQKIIDNPGLKELNA